MAVKNISSDQYTNPLVFEQESERLFSLHWWLIGCDAELDQTGSYISAEVGGARVFVVRDANGSLNGFHNICRHRAGPIVSDDKGVCPGKLLVCQYHGWSYDFTGGLVNAHDQTAFCDKTQLGLLPVRVEVWNQMVFVCLGDRAPSLLQWLGPIADQITNFLGAVPFVFYDSIEKTGDTNWKCYGDNACEGYHVAMVHKVLSETTENEEIELFCEPNGQYVWFDVTYVDTSIDRSRSGKGLWIYKFPGLLIHCSEFGFNAECVMPVSVGKIKINRWFWGDKSALSKASLSEKDMLLSASQVIDEDIRICAQVYENLCSGFVQPGSLSQVNEPGTIFFQQLVNDL